MPPKRSKAAAPPDAASKVRKSKLAKEHNITAEEEAEIKEAFGLFSKPLKGEKDGVIPTNDVRRAMIALGIQPTAPELVEFLSILDPDEEGFAIYNSFVAICALKLHARTRNSDTHNQDVDEAFYLFTNGSTNKITLATLRRVSQALNMQDDINDDLLRDMILEANGGGGVSQGVERAEFEAVMRRAGAWK